MAYVDKEYSKIGTELKVVVRKNDYDLKITKMPLVPSNYYRKKLDL